MTTSETGHPDSDTLADLTEDLLPDTQADAVRAHLVGCADCTRTLAAISAVGAELRAVPDPPLPAAVADRWRTAIRAEAANRSATTYAASHSADATHAPDQAADSGRPPLSVVPTIDDNGDGVEDSPVEVVTFAARRAVRQSTRRGRALLSVAAAAVLIAVVGGILIGVNQHRQQPDAIVSGVNAIPTADEAVSSLTKQAMARAGSKPVLVGSTGEQACAMRAVEAAGMTGTVVMVLPQTQQKTILVGLLPATTTSVAAPPKEPYTLSVVGVTGCLGGGPLQAQPPVRVAIP